MLRNIERASGRGEDRTSRGKDGGTHKINNEITAKTVRLIDSQGEMLGLRSIADALNMANAEGLDLVEISPAKEDPVCKILSYSKFLYETRKRTHMLKKKQKTTKIKEIKIRLTISENDYMIKMNNAREFISDGHRVKVAIRLRGRELLFKNLAIESLEKFRDGLADVAKIEAPIKREGSQFQLVFMPLKSGVKE